MEIKVSYIGTVDEYYHADEAFRQALNKGSVDLYVQIALWLIAIAFVFVGQYFLGSFMAVFAFMMQQGYFKRWIVRRTFNNMVNRGQEETLIFTDEAITYECGVVSEKIDWDSYAAFLETDQIFMIFYDSSDHYAIIPKRAIESEATMDKLRQLFNQKLADYEVKDV